MKTLLAFSYCGEHLKSIIGHINAIDHIKCLLACMDNTNPTNKHPMLITATKFSIDNRDEDERVASWELIKRATVISTPYNPGHQHGACWTIRYAMEYAGYMGYDYMFYTADDILFEDPDIVDKIINRMTENNLGYIGSTWGGTADLSTQVFGIKVSDFVNIQERKFIFNPIVFASLGVLLEQYMYSVVKAYKINYEIYNMQYHHHHHPHEIFTKLKLIEEKRKAINIPNP